MSLESSTPPRQKRKSSEAQKYSPPDRIKRKPGYRPANCGEPKHMISDLSTRTAYRRATDHIDEDPYNNCCTIEADIGLKLYMWKATELPVKLTKDRRSTTFLCFKELEYLKCSSCN